MSRTSETRLPNQDSFCRGARTERARMELRLIAREARHRDKKKPKYPHTNHKSASSTRRALMQVVLIVLLKLCAPSHDAHPQTARRTSFFTHHLRLISLAVVVGTRRPPAPDLARCSGRHAALPVALWSHPSKKPLSFGFASPRLLWACALWPHTSLWPQASWRSCSRHAICLFKVRLPWRCLHERR